MRGTDDPVRALLDAARTDDAGPGVKARVRAGVAAQMAGDAGLAQSGNRGADGPSPGTPSPGTLSPGTPSPGTLSPSLGKALIGALLTGVIGFAAGLSMDRGRAAPTQAVAQVDAATRGPTTPAGSPEGTSPRGAAAADTAPPAPAQADTAPPERAPSRLPVAPGGNAAGPSAVRSGREAKTASSAGRTTSPGGSGSAGSALGAELSLLREVQSALREGDSARAERWIDEHASRYPAGVLREEREAARVLLLCAKGQQAEAKAAAERFLAETPRSVQADRVRGSCAFAAKGDGP